MGETWIDYGVVVLAINASFLLGVWFAGTQAREGADHG